jgi:hypothetical protein
MPEFLEKALAKSANKKGLTGKHKAAYVYGGMNNLGAMHGNKETPKGKRMQAKHDKKVKTGNAYDFRKKRGRNAPLRMQR